MIDPKELRIGNYFEWSNIASMGKGVDCIASGQMIQDYQHFKNPIPLTPEWLERFGIPYDGQTSSEAYWYNRANKYLCEDYSEGDGGTHLIAECLYVHQLQNLYFTLTGQELKLKQ